ncbi:MAG: UDP-glucose/GDP-mannose dehydrogenase family protein [Planctomycetaceae bacterium]|nr:UDP-glucose/GDP-mannose dehydrogenase family protein [Planctomycetaceae bacterium]
MRIAVIGTGYVGLVTGTCFAETGNDVTCVDNNLEKIERLRRGEIPIFEPGLEELVERNASAGRLLFTTDLPEAVKPAEIVYLAVGTPQSDTGAADLSALFTVVSLIAPHLAQGAIVVTKSTVPVGTNAKIFARLKELTGREIDVASNPEFLKEGAAINDFMRPDRVVVGVRRKEVGEVLHQLYAPYLRVEQPFLVMSPESAEMTKYVANAMLATKISFINEMANLCERMSADINDVRRGIGHDQRIGFHFLFPGVGYGGSCFPKDIRAVESMAVENQMDPLIMRAVDKVNQLQKTVIYNKIRKHFGGDLKGRRIAIWGLAFKPQTDDIREAPALTLITQLLADGCSIAAHDPEAIANVRQEFGDKIEYAKLPYDALDGADALAIMTEWKQYQRPDFAQLKKRLKAPLIFDGRNVFELSLMREQGFQYYSIGRAPLV